MYKVLCNFIMNLSLDLPEVIIGCSCNECRESVTFSVPLSEFSEKLLAEIRMGKAECYATFELDKSIDEDLLNEMQLLIDKVNVSFPDLDEHTGDIVGGFAVDRNKSRIIYVRKMGIQKSIDEADLIKMVTTPILAYRKMEKPFSAILCYGFPADVAEMLIDDE